MPESCFPTEIYALYTIGSLDGPELLDFAQHIDKGCNLCQAELTQARELWTAYAAAGPLVPPPPGLKQRVISVAEPAIPTRRSDIPSFAWWQQAVTAVAMLGIGLAIGWNLHHPAPRVAELPAPSRPPIAQPAPPISKELEQENRTLHARIEALDKTIAAQEATLRKNVFNSQNSRDLEAVMARVQAEAQQARTRVAQLEAQARQLEGQASTAETRARDAEQRYQTADNARRQAVDREARLRETSAARIRDLENENARFRRVIDDQQKRIEQNLQLASFFASPNLRFYQYQGTRNGPLAKAHVVSLEGSKVVFYAYHLPQLPPGRTYQLWLIRGQSPAIVSGGVFQADQAGNAVVQFSDPAMVKDIRQFAVTDEPAGGSQGPTGKQFLRAAS